MSARYNASTIARWFIAWAEAEDADLSNMKLQKLLYYAQGHHLGAYKQPLFTDEIQAWSHGPVVPAVYHEWKHCGSSDVELAPEDPFTWDDVDEETAHFLGLVWNTYGKFGAWQLRNMTHEEPPWRKNWRGVQERDVKISNKDLEEYFASVTNRTE